MNYALLSVSDKTGIVDFARSLVDFGLNRQIIVVPDRDKPGEKLINQAIEFGWGVAFPEWHEDVEDTADAVAKYGRLFTMKSILKSTETNKLKIESRTIILKKEK